MAILTAGVALLPSCANDDGQKKSTEKGIPVTAADKESIAALCATIIPSTTGFPGAPELKSHEFLLTMLNDCTAPDAQQKFMQGLSSFDKWARSRFGNSFHKLKTSDQQSLITELEAKKENPGEDLLNFYQVVKGYTLQSFTSSKQYMLDIRDYKMIPGSHFRGCVKIA